MDPIIVDPHSYNKRDEFAHAQAYADEFLEMNGLPLPSKVITTYKPGRGRKESRHGWYDYGDQCLFVNLKKSRVPVKSPGFQWSYTGFKSDLTGPGILAHEVGHHVDNLLKVCKKHKRELIHIRRVEHKLSGYEPNIAEQFAEMMRLFILNPTLLREGRPGRWAFLTKVLELRPPHKVAWQAILQNANLRIIESAKVWIARSARQR